MTTRCELSSVRIESCDHDLGGDKPALDVKHSPPGQGAIMNIIDQYLQAATSYVALRRRFS